MARPLSPRYARFECVPRIGGSCLYAVLLSNGIVKVGFSRNPRTRMASLSRQVCREFGADVVSFRVGRALPRLTAAAMERDLLRRLRAIGTVIEVRAEFFQHVRFGQAKTLVQQISSRAA